jgi:hypothetical protein
MNAAAQSQTFMSDSKSLSDALKNGVPIVTTDTFDWPDKVAA